MTHRKQFSMSALLRLWGPVLALMAALYFSSAQPKVEQPDAGAIYFSGAMPIFADGWDFVLKKSGHVLAYGLLAVLLLRGLSRSGYSIRAASWLAVGLAMGYALSDEFHQSFVPGRRASLLDLGFDLLGAALAMLVARRILAARRRAKGAPSPTLADQRR